MKKHGRRGKRPNIDERGELILLVEKTQSRINRLEHDVYGLQQIISKAYWSFDDLVEMDIISNRLKHWKIK